VQAGAGENLGHFVVAHGREEGFEPLDEVGDAVGEPVHRLADLDQGVGSGVVEPARPGREGGGGELEALGGLVQGPAACGAEFEDGLPLFGLEVGAVLAGNAAHAGVFEADLLVGQGQFLLGALEAEPEALTSLAGGSRLGASHGQRSASQGDGVEDAGAYASGPATRQEVVRWRGMGHEDLHGGRFESATRRQHNPLRSMGMRESEGRSESVAPPR